MRYAFTLSSIMLSVGMVIVLSCSPAFESDKTVSEMEIAGKGDTLSNQSPWARCVNPTCKVFWTTDLSAEYNPEKTYFDYLPKTQEEQEA